MRIVPSSMGLEMFWHRLSELPPGQELAHQGLTFDGERRTAARVVFDAAIDRHFALGDPGTLGGIRARSGADGEWRKFFVIARGERVVAESELPEPAHDYGTIAVGWDPSKRRWLLVGEEHFKMPDQPATFGAPLVYSRLFVMRFDEHGGVVVPRTYLTEPYDSATISEWGNPVAWVGDRFAFVWERHPHRGDRSHAFVAEMGSDGIDVKQIPISTVKRAFRGHLAALRGGYVIAGSELCRGPELCSRAFVTTVRDGVVGPVRWLADSRVIASGPMVASDRDGRVAVAWHESDPVASGPVRETRVRAGVLDERGELASAYKTEPAVDRHDWVHSIAWDGCRFVLAHGVGISPSSVRLAMFR